MAERLAAGWDVGGAHLKFALAASERGIVEVVQLPCPLWQGMAELTRAIAAARGRLPGATRHGVTMTGELADLFATRGQGVARLVEALRQGLPEGELMIYGGRAGFLAPAAAAGRADDVASANWHASASLAARRLPQGLLIDIGSTTCDLVPFCDGDLLAEGYSDAERLAADELVYTGATRTAVMAVARQAPFQGRTQGLMAEVFATMADVHRLTGELPEGLDLLPTADGRDKSQAASRARLARMLGRDGESAEPAAWRRLAEFLAELQRQRLWEACQRVLSRGVLDDAAPLVAAGVGRFLVGELARRLRRPTIDFAALVTGRPEVRDWAAHCAPAAAVALLALEHQPDRS